MFRCACTFNTFSNNTPMNTTAYQDMYASSGYLFYGIAASDGRIAKAEGQKLKEEVTKHWLPLENSRDEFGTDAAHYIGISFDYANDQEMDAEEAFAKFLDDYQQEPARYDHTMKELILKTASAIASSFAGKNKAELVRLSRLQVAFNA